MRTAAIAAIQNIKMACQLKWTNRVNPGPTEQPQRYLSVWQLSGKITFRQTRRQLAEFFRGRSRLLVESDRHFPVEEGLIVQHGDGLDRLNGVVELDDGVAAGLSVFVSVQLGCHHTTGQAEHFSKLLLVNRV